MAMPQHAHDTPAAKAPGPRPARDASPPAHGPSAHHGDRSAAPRIVGRRYHLYSPSIFYICVTIFIGLGAFNAQNNLLFFVFGVTLATLIVSGIVSGTMMMSIGVRRIIADAPQVGQPAPISYRVTNLNRRLPMFAIHITEWAEKPARPAPGGRDQQPATTGKLGRSRGFAAFVPAGGSVVVASDAIPLRAGPARLRGFEVSTVFPFGIARKSVRFAQPASITIHQPVVPIATGTLGAIEAAGRAQRESSWSSRASGEEFFGIREYSPGDPMRLIAWRASARSGELRTRMNAAPPRPAARLLIDLEGLDDTPREIADPRAPARPVDPLGRALSWPLRVMGFLADPPRDHPPMLSETDRALALAGSLALALLGRGYAVEVAEARDRFAVPSGSGARQGGLILQTLARRESIDPDAGSNGTRQSARRTGSAAITLRLVPAATETVSVAPATPAAPLSGQASSLTWTYERLDASITLPSDPRPPIQSPAPARVPGPRPRPGAAP